MNLYEQYIHNLNEASDNYITLYHNTSNENAISISKEGIIPGLRKSAYGSSGDTEGSGIWCSTVRGYGYGGATITFKINANDEYLKLQNDTEYMVYRKIEPNEILDIDLVVSSIVAVDSHNLVESDIPNAIRKYGKDKFLNVMSKYSNKFVEPYNIEQLKHLIETGEKYCKGNISLLESYSINNLPKSVKDIKNMNQFFRDIINQEEDKYWREMLKDAYTCDRNILNPNETPLKRKREIVQKYLDKKHNLTEGVHLYAFVKDEDGNNKIIEDSDYPNKESFKKDLQANGYTVRRVSDEVDMYIMDHSDYRSVNEIKSKIRRIEKDIKDNIALPSEKIELENLKDLLNNLPKNSLTEKASIDWNNFLTRDEVDQLFSKDDKVESAEEIIYNTKGNFYNKYYKDFKKEGWTKRELTQNLADFCYNGHFNGKQVLRESSKDFELWKKQIASKSRTELINYYNTLISKTRNPDKYNYLDIINKINYIEDTYNISTSFKHNLK